VTQLLAHPRLAGVGAPSQRVAAARQALEAARAEVRAGDAVPSRDHLAERAALIAEALDRPSLRAVINATGVILHTNLGRAPLSDDALTAMQAVSAGYSNLEFDLDAGERGSRFSHLEGLLRQVTGAEAAIAVNNNAAAMVLALSALCQGREVVVSRGQAVEIGGGFRIPDVLRQSGASLVEVGTTNRTYLSDFEAAVTDRTVAFLRVHPSNFRISGFTTFPAIADMAALAHRRGVLLLDDLGSGCLLDTRAFGLAAEPTVQDSVRAGADVVAFSGDKLLGGPQAGILAGAVAAINTARRHPLARAIRMDKAGIAALAATLVHYARGEALTALPIWTMIAANTDDLRARAQRWQAASTCESRIVAGRSMIGGGSMPEESLPTYVLAIDHPHPTAASAHLRALPAPIICRAEGGRLLFDPRTVLPRQDDAICTALENLTSSLI
jgi:L-seryl-tRNA(Ser) seleniumtransferase